MANTRITKRTVDALTPDAREYVRWDSELTGFGVRVRPTGVKSFVAVYRTGGRNSPLRKVTIGAVGKIEVEKAREAARKIIAGAELGQDHAAERAKARAEMTVAQLCDLYLSEGCDTKKASTLVTDRGRIERHIKPLFGKKRVSEVTRIDVEKFLRDVANGKTAADVKTKTHGRAIVEGARARRRGPLDFSEASSLSRCRGVCGLTIPFAALSATPTRRTKPISPPPN
jgi:hypothetical protein